MLSIQQVCKNYFHLIHHPAEKTSKRRKALAACAILSCITVIVPASMGLVYGLAKLVGKIKRCGQDPKVQQAASSTLPSATSSRSSTGSSGEVLDTTLYLLELAQRIEETDGDKSELLQEWNDAFQERIVATEGLGPFFFYAEDVKILAGFLAEASNLKLFITKHTGGELSNPKPFDKSKINECKQALKGENPSEYFWMEIYIRHINFTRFDVGLQKPLKVREVPQFMAYWLPRPTGISLSLDFSERQDKEKIGAFNLFSDYEITDEAVEKQKKWMEGLE